MAGLPPPRPPYFVKIPGRMALQSTDFEPDAIIAETFVPVDTNTHTLPSDAILSAASVRTFLSAPGNSPE